MKRLLSILLLSLLIFQVSGYFAVFRLMQSGIRKDIFREIDSGTELGALVELLVPNDPSQAAFNGYSRVGNREIIFKGIYFDIVRSEQAGAATRYYCFTDKEESELASQINKSCQSEDPNKIGVFQNLITLTLTNYLVDQSKMSDTINSFKPIHRTRYFFSIMTWDPVLIVPPPQFDCFS